AACARPAQAQTAAELLDLGEKYLLAMNYSQAAVKFMRAIEIEPKNPRAYIGAAEAFVGLGDTARAMEILKAGLDELPGDPEITAMLAIVEEAIPAPEPTPEPAPVPTPEPATTAATAPEPTPIPTPEPEQAPTPEPATELAPEPTPGPTLTPEPSPTARLLPNLAPSALPRLAATPEFYVADYAGALTSATKDNIVDSNGNSDNGLEALCDGAQIVVVTVKHLDGMRSDEYAKQLFSDWGVGSSSANNGMLLLLATEEKKGWLEVGSGIRPYWPEDTIGTYLNDYFWDDVDAGRYDAAVNNLLEPLFSWYADYYELDFGNVAAHGSY
ncbi:MAG: TPM domain-containing protein, partial [Clostridiales bacterium]|nr:TPM domain-containing protein [Clostridiales bacterium]